MEETSTLLRLGMLDRPDLGACILRNETPDFDIGRPAGLAKETPDFDMGRPTGLAKDTPDFDIGRPAGLTGGLFIVEISNFFDKGRPCGKTGNGFLRTRTFFAGAGLCEFLLRLNRDFAMGRPPKKGFLSSEVFGKPNLCCFFFTRTPDLVIGSPTPNVPGPSFGSYPGFDARPASSSCCRALFTRWVGMFARLLMALSTLNS